MPLEQVGLEYVSKNVTDFIKNTKIAENEVSKLNTTIIKISVSSKSYTSVNNVVSESLKGLSTQAKTTGTVLQNSETKLKSLNSRLEKTSKDTVLVADGVGVVGNAMNFLANNVQHAEGVMFGHSGTIQNIFAKYITLPPAIQNSINRLEQFINSMIKANNIFGKTLVVLDRFIKFKDIFEFLKFQESAKDANTFSESIRKSGDSLNRLENTLRAFSLGLLIIQKRSKQVSDEIATLRKGILVLARGLDKVSDFFGDWSKEVKDGDKNLKDFNEEQGISIEKSEEFGNSLPFDKLAKMTTGLITVGNAASNLHDASKGEEPKGLVGVLFDAFKVKKLIKVWAGLPPPIQAAAVAVTAFAGVSILTEAIGERAAGLNALSDSFERLRQSAGLSQDFLENFTESADNQLKQSEILTLSNKALAGSQGEFQKELANTLPTLLEFARVRSAATGEDVNFLFESLIQGIKKGQPLILDNLGLVVKLDEVYQKFAAANNTTVDALSAQQKQLALLNSVQKEAVRNIDILGEATLSNADKIAARGNIIGDILDSISLSVQPLLSVILNIQLFFLNLIGDALEPFVSIINSINKIVADLVQVLFVQLAPILEFVFALLGAIVAPFEAIFRVVSRLISSQLKLVKSFAILDLVLRPLINLLNGVAFLFKTIGDVLVGVIDFFSRLGDIIGQILGTILAPLVNFIQNNFLGAFSNVNEIIKQTAVILTVGFGRAVASLVNTFARAARDILTIVGNLAQGIADFLIGESPPPKGPLSKIDSGGQKTFEAFLDGFSKASLKPVEQVAGEVNDTLGNIGSLNIDQVESRLERLDLAIRPFNEQLQIAQARFDAISEPAEAALRAIDRQLDTAVQALVKGTNSIGIDQR
jgi:hypothetical protein